MVAAKPAAPRIEVIATVAPAASTVTTLHADDRDFLGRVMRFLLAIQTPDRAARAQREGYTPQEHREGWKLWRTAAGQDRPLDHWFQSAHQGAHDPARLDEYRQIDAFENTWFPRTRAIIHRVITPAHRAEFEQGFFHDLSQQPLGPGVVGSVGTYLARVDDLGATKEPGAALVRKTLRARGLSDQVIAQMRARLTALEAPVAPVKKTAAAKKLDARDLAAAQQAQTAALESLHAWFNDWGTTLRSVFDVATQIELGLAAAHGRGHHDAAKGPQGSAGAPNGAPQGSSTPAHGVATS